MFNFNCSLIKSLLKIEYEWVIILLCFVRGVITYQGNNPDSDEYHLC